MAKLGIIFGTESGYTRKTAKFIAKKLGDELADKPININRLTLEGFLAYDAMILGTPTYGDGELPGTMTGIESGSWGDFVGFLKGIDMSGKVFAIYGFGDQKVYPSNFVDAMKLLYDHLTRCGATVVGAWPDEGYEYQASRAVVDGQFVGLALDEKNQSALTDERVEQWLALVKPALMAVLK